MYINFGLYAHVYTLYPFRINFMQILRLHTKPNNYPVAKLYNNSRSMPFIKDTYMYMY